MAVTVDGNKHLLLFKYIKLLKLKGRKYQKPGFCVGHLGFLAAILEFFLDDTFFLKFNTMKYIKKQKLINKIELFEETL